VADRDNLGASLEALTNPVPTPLLDHWADDDPHPVELAATTPAVTRLRALHDAARDGGVLATDALAVVGRAAPSSHHRPGSLSQRDLGVLITGAALDAGLARFDERTALLHPGPEAVLLTDEPLAAWWEALQAILFGDPLATDGVPGDTAMLPFLLFQYITSFPRAELEPCCRALHEEMARARGRRGRPSRREVRRDLAALLGLLVEFGLVQWQPDGQRLGTARCTTLGAFGFGLLLIQVHGPSEVQDRLIQEAGYLPADGGYVHRRDLPIDISVN
jgi:hypothetical protein